MKNAFLRTVFRPLIERVGTMLAAYLIARSFDSDLAAQLGNALVALLCVAFDLVVARYSREREENKILGAMYGPVEWPEELGDGKRYRAMEVD